MTSITLDDALASQIREATDGVELRDKSGAVVAYISPTFAAEGIEAAARLKGSEGPWYSTQEVLNHLQSLDNA